MEKVLKDLGNALKDQNCPEYKSAQNADKDWEYIAQATRELHRLIGSDAKTSTTRLVDEELAEKIKAMLKAFRDRKAAVKKALGG